MARGAWPPEAASAELEAEASRQIGLLQPGRREGVLTAACERLEGLLQDAPAAIAPLLAADAAFPLMQLLDAPGPAGAVHAAALRLLAAAVAGRPRGIPCGWRDPARARARGGYWRRSCSCGSE